MGGVEGENIGALAEWTQRGDHILCGGGHSMKQYSTLSFPGKILGSFWWHARPRLCCSCGSGKEQEQCAAGLVAYSSGRLFAEETLSVCLLALILRPFQGESMVV